ncbi:MAG: xylulokinase, partial [Actinobacteria bacterium]|nr:xylulokinase [Actinomycetota bacterium]
ILADVLSAKIAVVGTEEGAAYGAALLAAVGSGWFATVEQACRATITVEPAASPSDLAADYDRAHERYTELYPALAPTFHTA